MINSIYPSQRLRDRSEGDVGVWTSPSTPIICGEEVPSFCKNGGEINIILAILK